MSAGGSAIASSGTAAGRTWMGRAVGAGLAGIAITGALAVATPSASAGVTATRAVTETVISATSSVDQVSSKLVRTVVIPASPVDLTAAAPGRTVVAYLPGRHEVASPEAIGTSTAVGAGVGAVVGFGIGFLAAPLVGTIGAAVAGAVSAAVCAGATAGLTCGIVIPLVVAISWPVAVIASPLVGMGIGAAIGARIGAAVGTTSAEVSAPKVPQATRVQAPAAVVTPKPVAEIAKDPTVQNIVTAVDRAIATNPQLGPVGDLARSFLPKH
ncbi:hypothetical protein [Gordonia bronchialis]|uniref:hypothetical protein n=1 Tax=Gordonia bronchialis TaxID=2054 RepID=UPI0022716A50|nr:hypothetical protein [Gordonia bronchialis]